MPEVGNFTDADVEKYVREIAAQEAAKVKGAEPPKVETPPESKELVLNIGGQNMTFKDAEEAGKVLTSFYQQQAQNSAVPQKPQGVEVGKEPLWTSEDQTKYVDLLTKNPIEAAEYVDSKRYGVARPSELFKQNFVNQAQTASQMAVDQFIKENPDYYVDPENLKVMDQTLREYGVNPAVGVTKLQLEAAFAVADRRGLLKHAENTEDNRNTSIYNNDRYTPPVATRRNTISTADEADYLADAENMTVDQLEKVLMKFQR